MADSFRKVRAGEQLQFSASAYNAFVDAAVANQNQRTGPTKRMPVPSVEKVTVLVRNDSGADRGRFEVVGIDVPLIGPADNPITFQNRIALSGVAPASAHSGKFAVLQEPLAQGKIGRAVITGTTLVMVNVSSETDPFADVTDGDAAALTTAAIGPARILWLESANTRTTTGVAWALVSLGGGAGSSAGPSGSHLAKLTDEIQYAPTGAGPTRKRYHWQEAEYDATTPGNLQVKLGGRASKDKLVADLVSLESSGTNQPTLVSPVQGATLFDDTTTNGTGNVELVWNKISGGTDYYASVGDAANPTKYLANLSMGDVDRVTVGGLPIDGSDIYVRLRMDNPVGTPNTYKLQLSQSGQDLRYTTTVSPYSLSDPTQGLWLTPTSGTKFDASALNGDGTYNLAMTFSAVAGAGSYLIKAGTTPGAFDITIVPTAVTSATLNSIPADGSTFYVTIEGGVINIYAVTITPPEDTTVLNLEESNLLGDFPTDYTLPTPEVAITDSVWVYIFETTNSAGVTQRVFIHLPKSATGDGQWMSIVSSIGAAAPYTYTVKPVAPIGGGAWGTPTGVDASAYAIDEQGTMGSGLAPIDDNEVVLCFPDGLGDYLFSRSGWKGTYP